MAHSCSTIGSFSTVVKCAKTLEFPPPCVPVFFAHTLGTPAIPARLHCDPAQSRLSALAHARGPPASQTEKPSPDKRRLFYREIELVTMQRWPRA